MSGTFHFATNNIAVYGPSDGRTLLYSGLPGKAISVSSRSSHSYNKTTLATEFEPLKCSSSRGKFLVCNAGTGSYRRNPAQNRFSRNRNRQNEERDGSNSNEEPEIFTSRNGPMLSMSSAPRFQATAAPGPREREIVELFRKVQAQLRERAAVKEEKKREELPGQQGKESETVDSLLKLLRKHTNQQGKKGSKNTNNNSSNKDFILDESKQNGSFNGSKSSIYLDLGDNGKDLEVQEPEPSSFTRPASNFRRRSPVPKMKFQPFDSDSVTDTYIRPRREEPEVESESKLDDVEPGLAFSDEVDEFDELSDDNDVASDDEDGYSDEEEDEEEEEIEEEDEVAIAVTDYNAMKLTELRALAKSRGIKGFSKMKKADLVELLKGD